MPYTKEISRAFWFAFDDYFKYQAGVNGLAARYQTMGGYNRPSVIWKQSRIAGRYPQDFVSYAQGAVDTLRFLAGEQKRVMEEHFGANDIPSLMESFKDFAFGVLASPDQRPDEPVHTMNGGLEAVDYFSWHGFIEAVLVISVDSAFWKEMRWINGFTWELQVKARPQEIFPNKNTPLAPAITNAIVSKWQTRRDNVDAIAAEFDDYDSKPLIWMS